MGRQESPGQMFPFPFHCEPTVEEMPSVCLESKEAAQVREGGLTTAFKCMNCFIGCKEIMPSLARLTSPFPACEFSTSSISLADTWPPRISLSGYVQADGE